MRSCFLALVLFINNFSVGRDNVWGDEHALLLFEFVILIEHLFMPVISSCLYSGTHCGHKYIREELYRSPDHVGMLFRSVYFLFVGDWP